MKVIYLRRELIKLLVTVPFLIFFNIFSAYSFSNISKGDLPKELYSYTRTVKPSIKEPIITYGIDSTIVEAEIIAEGGQTITERGIIYNIHSDNKVEVKRIAPGSGSGRFKIVLKGLEGNKLYSVKLYAQTTEGVFYGPEKQFDTFGLPKFVNTISGQVSYDKEFSSIVKVETTDLPGTTVKAIQKPEWLKLQSEPKVSIFAGSTTIGSANGIRNQARFFAPYALASDSKGNIYVADQVDNRIRKISEAGEVSTVAGALIAGFKDGLGVDARFDTPSGIAVDQHGNIYISDQQNNSIRKISPTGMVVTVAGSQQAGYVDGDAATARFNSPAGICVDSKGFIYVADRGNNRIRKISPEGKVSTLAGSGNPGYSEGKGNNAKFNAPTGIVVDSWGSLYVTDEVNNRIRKISPEGEVSTFAGSGEFSLRDGAGREAAFKYPTGIVADRFNNLYVTDQLNNLIRRISPSGKVTSIVINSNSDAKSGTASLSFKNPTGICLNTEGKVFIADYHNHNVKEIDFKATLSGTPTKSQVGSYEIVLQASNEFGTAVQSGKLIVRDTIAPTIESTFPANLGLEIPRTLNAVITFDEAVSLRDSGSVTIFQADQIVVKYNIQQAVAKKEIILSDDQKSLTLKLKSLPAEAKLRITVDNGIVMDKAGNLFQKSKSPLASWSFTTKQKEVQTIDLQEYKNKTYGDPVFCLGPIHSTKGLPIVYSAEDPSILLIKGDTARILKSGKTNIIAFQNGDSEFREVKVSQPLTILARQIVIKPIANQVRTYGGAQSPITFEFVSGSLVNEDKFVGQLEKTPGDTVGTYMITAGSLTPGNNYELKVLNETLAIQKAPLLIKAQNQTKIAGTPNPKFAFIYEGFVNMDGPGVLLTKPEFTCKASDSSPIGNYIISLNGAVAKNYTISYQSAMLNILPTGATEFNVTNFDLFENMISGTTAAKLIQNNPGNQPIVFTFSQGEGDEDNSLFKINGNSITTVRPFDYESKHQYSVRVKADGSYGETTEKKITILLNDVNERPEMNKIPFNVICSNGIINLTGISAGPEKDQDVKIRVENTGSKANLLEFSQSENGISQLSYKVAEGVGNVLNLRIVLKDNGGNANGGIDSAVYTYSLNVERQAPIQIISEKGSTLLRGTASVLEAKASGKFQWYFNGQKLSGENSRTFRLTAEESGTVSVQVVSEEGCIVDSKIAINVVKTPPVTCTNLISANFDGINDVFVVRNIEYYPGNEIWILDRTGKLIFNQKNYQNSWNGTHSGSTLPVGSYYYMVDLGNKTPKLKGSISLID